MSLDDLNADVKDAYSDLGDELTTDLDRETRNELAMLLAAFDGDEGELVRRAIHALYRSTVDTGDLDFHLRQGYDVTYDEYLSGMTYDEMTGADQYPQRDDERRYQM
ncbi:hypothetical protein DU500_15620 [Haloplanus rubicundus]|uniref:Uncharacterized protein n=1 Tax=Haloplanus rubicundus TaxID=1547898 RepID=A0A345E6B8_9EURY|nr:hypothetical protein [Haloplanus rubicundus]AXG07740.1 hypothetical protein DU500_15620 [Haloplanus rubicundus]AXG11158.1 hypothetical protein DU484_15600 [Haloplanus rubicundus]